MRAFTWSVLAVGLVVVGIACGVPMRGGSYFEDEWSADRYRTFTFGQHDDTRVGDSRFQDNAFFEDRLHAAIERELLWRGIRLDPSSADLRVHHHVSTEDHAMVTEAIEESGYTREEIYEYEEGTILVHLVDARTGENVWLGWGQANIEPAFTSPRLMTEWIDDVVSTMFADWPGPERVD